ncbi:hypothetical protein [Streptomyces sp. NPDC047043]|uniref:hypothetical protein n=1 Tax=Streptomyces sp. NPDC047043 TaxID=3154497 RepID=UPI0033FBF80E
MFQRSRWTRTRTVTPLTGGLSKCGMRRILIASVTAAIGALLVAGVLTHMIEPEQGTAIGSIAAATIAVIAYVLHRPSPEAVVMGEEDGASPSLK